MRGVFDFVRVIANSESSVLITGESGTGKEMIANVIHHLSVRRHRPFVAVSCAILSETLIESELFGHRKGSFTGAVDHHVGVLERCSAHGALFLDEIGEASAPIQINLLRVLQDRTFVPVGSREERHFAGRVIAATNRSWAELRAEGTFRDDFYYRLCSDVIRLPTLRERIAASPRELEDLVRVVVSRIAGEQQAALVPIALEALHRDLPRDYAWPGNVRELEQAVRRIVLTGRYVSEPEGAASNRDQQFSDLARAGQLTAKDLLGRYCAMLYAQLGTYAEVAARTGLDRRTARKYIADYSDTSAPLIQ